MSELTKKTILIVDDEPTNLGVLYQFLRDKGFVVLLSSDGKSALNLVQNRKPDLILLDILMPELDGFETCKKMKNIEIIKDIPIIFMSALSDTIDKVKGFQVGAVDFIIKPCQKDEVLARISAHLTIRQQQEELELLNANKDRLFSILSHDLRSPFMSIIGFGKLLMEGNESFTADEARDIGAKIYNTGKNTFKLLENLLDWAKLQQEKLEINLEQLNLFDVIYENTILFNEVARAKNVKIANILKEEIEIFADREILNTVFRNLLSNAIKFSQEGGIIEISARINNDKVEISIKDSGVGISESDMGKLFQIGFKHSTIGTKGEKGTGLGMILCKELLEKCGGQIFVDSKIGEGTLITFNIPLQKQ